MKIFFQISNDRIIKMSSIIRLDRWYIKNYEYNSWKQDYDNLMNNVINAYIEKHSEILLSNKTDSEIMDNLRQKFDKHIRNQLGNMDPGHNEYTILTTDDTIINISKETYYALCKEMNIDMTKDYDDFYNTEKSLDEELIGLNYYVQS